MTSACRRAPGGWTPAHPSAGRISGAGVRSARHGQRGNSAETYVDLVVDRADVHAVPVRTPAHGRHGAADVERRHGLLSRVVAALPYFHGAVVRAGGEELRPRAAGHGAVDRVDDFAVRAYFLDLLAGRHVGHGESVVGRHGVEEGGEEGPLQVENRRFCVAGEKPVVGVGCVCPPQSSKESKVLQTRLDVGYLHIPLSVEQAATFWPVGSNLQLRISP